MFSKIAMAAIVANFANAINIQAYKGTATQGNNAQQPQQHQAMNGSGNNTQQPQQNPPTHKDWKKFMKTHKKAVKNAMKAFPNVVKSLEKKYP
jgi:3-oxoacyl-[acyl-carrier-protein] synthase III